MNRRDTILALAALGATPLVASAQQQGKVWRVGFLATSRVESADSDRFYGPFMWGMRDLGYIEGKNLTIVLRSAEGKAESLPRFASELVALKVDAIVAVGTTAISAAQKASSTVPIVMATAADPVASGFVKSLSRPAGNITGLSNLGAELSVKQLELLREIVPRLSSVGLLFNGTSSISSVWLSNVQAATQRTKLRFVPLEARTPEELEKALTAMAQQKVGAVIVPGNVLFTQQRRRIVNLIGKYKLPSTFVSSDWVEIGGLMSYGPNRSEDMRRAATYVDRIFKGAKPGDLPVEQPTKLELVINRNTAKTLGVTIPQSLLIRADRVIE
jgi:putative ABC transport system substrate-binding protein